MLLQKIFIIPHGQVFGLTLPFLSRNFSYLSFKLVLVKSMTFLRPRNMAIAIREIEPKEIPSCSMPHPLIAYTWRLDISS